MDDWLEPADACGLRARCRAAVREAHENPHSPRAWLASLMDVAVKEVEPALGLPFFGQAWVSLEKASPKLIRTPVPVVDLPLQVVAAEAILHTLRGADGLVDVGRVA